MEGGKFKTEGGKFENEERTFYFLFASHFSKFVFVYQNGNFLLGKSILRREKNQEKWLGPLKKIFLLCPSPNIC